VSSGLRLLEGRCPAPPGLPAWLRGMIPFPLGPSPWVTVCLEPVPVDGGMSLTMRVGSYKITYRNVYSPCLAVFRDTTLKRKEPHERGHQDQTYEGQ